MHAADLSLSTLASFIRALNVQKFHLWPSIALTAWLAAKLRPEYREDILDIEDLVTFGRLHKGCPYYLSKDAQNMADIVFLPYNYILDPEARKAQNIDLTDSVLIFDEAHNLVWTLCFSIADK